MLAFSTFKNPDNKFSKIPPEINSSHKFIVYCNNRPLGVTYGSSCGRLIVNLPDGSKCEFSLEELKRIQKRNIAPEQLLKYGSIKK